MRILIFSTEFPPEIGGAGVVGQLLASEFSQDHDVTVLCKSNKTKRFNDKFKIIEIVETSKFWFLDYIKYIDYQKYDVIILNDYKAIYIAGLYFDKLTLSKCFSILHGSEPENIYLNPSIFRKLTLFSTVFTRALFRCRRIFAVSEFMKEKFIQKTNLKALAWKIEVHYIGYNNSLFYHDRDDSIREKLEVPNFSDLIISAARLVKGKGFFETLAYLENEVFPYGDHYWVVAGDGNDLREMSKRVSSSKYSSRIRLLGRVSQQELRKLYSSSDVFLLLSNYEESFSLAHLESQACLVPAIGWNRFGNKEAILDKETGFLLDKIDELAEVLLSKKYKDINIKSDNPFIVNLNSVRTVKRLFSKMMDLI